MCSRHPCEKQGQKAGVMMQKTTQRKPGISLARGAGRLLLIVGGVFVSAYLFLLGLTALSRLKAVNERLRRLTALTNKRSSKRGDTLPSRIAGTRLGNLYFNIGTIKHIGRKSGREYLTTLSVYPLGDGFILALAYPETDWALNILASGKCTLSWRKQVYELERPEFIPRSKALAAYPLLVKPFIFAEDMQQFLWLHKQRTVPEQERGLVEEQSLMPDATPVSPKGADAHETRSGSLHLDAQVSH